ncbi:MAG: carbohydrate ABC transporter permease [Caldilinea sp.]|nr:carbohydrate ABC transporter permease [Caldilinea sp.]MDW8439133.1 carbohydrate ABC transporter permease [Caldilineaceae bacterium]
MTATSEVRIPPVQRRRGLGMAGRRRLLRIFALTVMLIYSALTLFPFYALFVRSFVSTRDAAQLHLWIPEAAEVSMDMQVGNLGVFYNLDMAVLKDALGIPQEEFLMARTTLRQISERYNIPEERIQNFFEGFYTFNGWRTLLTGSLYGTTFWAALGRTLLITAISLTLVIILSIFTGYGLSGLRRRDQMLVYNIYLLQMVIPAMLILLPQFLIFQWFFSLFPGYSEPGPVRWVLQWLAIILINIKGTALSTMIFTSAISAVPKELEDSASIDGASSWQYVRYILLPLLKVPIVSVVVIMLPLIYNQFLEPYVYLDPSNTTLLPFTQSAVGQFSTNFQLIYSAILASIVPLVLVYLLFRRFFVEGVMAGAIKG